MKAETRNVTVALSPEAYVNLKVLMARLGLKSYSQTLNKLVELETKEPHAVQSADK